MHAPMPGYPVDSMRCIICAVMCDGTCTAQQSTHWTHLPDLKGELRAAITHLLGPVSEAFETTRVLSLTHLLGAMHGPAVLHDMHRPVCIEQDAVRNAAGFLLCLIVAPAISHSQQQSASHRGSCHCEAAHL
jgi:hypothetical protein